MIGSFFFAFRSIGIDGLTNSILSDLVLRYSPQYYVFIANSTNVVFNDFDISGFSSSENEAKNTDGWDTYRSKDITIMNSVINNGDGESLTSTPCSVSRDAPSSPFPSPSQYRSAAPN